MSVITHLLRHWDYGNFSLSKLACFKITSVTLFALLVFCCFMFRQRGNRRNERTPVFWPTPSKWTADSTAALPACPEGAISNRFMTRCENDRRLSEFIIEQISGLFFKTVWTLRILERLIGGIPGGMANPSNAWPRAPYIIFHSAASATCVQNGRKMAKISTIPISTNGEERGERERERERVPRASYIRTEQ